jgi:hypothetical protein
MARSLAARLGERSTDSSFAGQSQLEKVLDLIRISNRAVQDHEIT